MWWPLQGEITTEFGEANSYYIGGAHTGIDIAGDTGAAVRAAAAGKVAVAWKRSDNIGWHIVLNHGGGWSTLYGHLSKFFVEEGDSVERGEVIGAVGDTGFSFGPHLHLELRHWGVLLDPLDHLP
jgi:murein DD-endopeptidase MepM/ murein hydrolase activator NlpD